MIEVPLPYQGTLKCICVMCRGSEIRKKVRFIIPNQSDKNNRFVPLFSIEFYACELQLEHKTKNCFW